MRRAARSSGHVRLIALGIFSAVLALPARGLAQQTAPQVVTSSQKWGWFVVIPSLAAGTLLTLHGLAIDCRQNDSACQRRAGVAIWGGVGIASFGSLLGIGIVQSGGRSAGVAIAGTLD